MSEDIAFRERRYLLMMGIRVLCFVVTIVMFAAHAGWFAAIPATGAILIPYFAVVFANGGREPSSTQGFRVYEPNLPDRFSSPPGTDDERSRSVTGE
jgi:O-antigen/teichoic acid export membrane protein